MHLLQAVLMGLIQGLTEFLPVSSSGHLVLTSSLYKYFTNNEFMLGSGEEVFFDIILHVGTLLAVLIFFSSFNIKSGNTHLLPLRSCHWLLKFN